MKYSILHYCKSALTTTITYVVAERQLGTIAVAINTGQSHVKLTSWFRTILTRNRHRFVQSQVFSSMELTDTSCYVQYCGIGKFEAQINIWKRLLHYVGAL